MILRSLILFVVGNLMVEKQLKRVLFIAYKDKTRLLLLSLVVTEEFV